MFLLKMYVLMICTLMLGIHNACATRQNHVQNLKDSTNVFTVNGSFPVVVVTWNFIDAAKKAWDVLNNNGTSLDAVEQGCIKCEELQCGGTVGYGGSPDENGETTLDAMIMDGESHNVGSVGSLRRVKQAISVARQVMERTGHTLLVGSQATDFALMMGFEEENLSTSNSDSIFSQWKSNNCQPNFWHNVTPDPATSCGPYTRTTVKKQTTDPNKMKPIIDEFNHDTIGMVAIDNNGRIAGGTSTNGASHKIPGRVGDSPIVGSGAYVDKDVGGAAATGDGDIMMRFMPSLLTVENMKLGMDPYTAANLALKRIIVYYPDFSGAIVSVNINGVYGAACYNLDGDVFNYSVGSPNLSGVEILSAPCIVSNKK